MVALASSGPRLLTAVTVWPPHAPEACWIVTTVVGAAVVQLPFTYCVASCSVQAAPAAGGAKAVKGRPLPARKAKLLLLETLRDLAVEDAAFAGVIVPLLREFLVSRGPSERAACLVALTRIDLAHPAPKDAA